MKGKITFSGRICDFELITRKDLIERGYKYMEKMSGIFYKDYDIDFDAPKSEYSTEVKLTFNNGKEIKLDGAEIDSIIPTVRGTFSVYLPASLTPPFYEDVKKIEINNKNNFGNMDVKDLLISVGELHSAMTDAHINAITTALVGKMRENMETMLPAFHFKDDDERHVLIERALITYEMGIKDGICEWLKTNK